MEANEKIIDRRKELGLSDVEIAQKAGLSIYEYGDIEQHADEIVAVTELHEVKKLLAVLKMDFLDTLEINCAFCSNTSQYLSEYSLLRNELLRKQRESLGMSREALGESIGFFAAEIENLEKNPDHLEAWSMDYIRDLSKVLKLPLQVLLNVKCSKCGR